MKNIITALYCWIVFTGCGTSKHIDEKAIANSYIPAASKEQSKTMLQSGVDFFATGNNPANWQLAVNYDDTVRFTADDGLTFKFGYNQLKKEIATDKTIYSINIKAGYIEIDIVEKICTVATIREVFKKEVTVTFNKIIYTGCGKFLADDNLNNKWLLEKVGNTLINAGEYNKIPLLEFKVAAGKVSGNDGCNNIGGNIEVQGKRIKFSALFGTRMACNKKSIEKIISAQISEKTVDYYFKDNRLYLYLPDDSILVFRKET